tara:strand:+ start:957 stop:1178 length:222 start_codon:yes stop_codon:yes gene_type:complete
MPKSKKIGIELDDYHYHEVMDRLSVIMDNIDRQLMQHPVIKVETEVKDLVDEGLTTLYKAYVKAAEINSKTEN